MRCENCSHTLHRDGREWVCDRCELYNAAIRAQQAAAQHIATNFDSGATGAWLNTYGVFAWIDGVTVQVGTPEQAAPFLAMTGNAFECTVFQARASKAGG